MCFIHPHDRRETGWILLSPLDSRMVVCPGGVINHPGQDGSFQKGGVKMRYLHTLDPDDFRDMQEFQEDLAAKEYAEYLYQEECRERYYENKYNN